MSETPRAVIAEAGYWHTAQIQAITDRGIEVLVAPDDTMREGKRPGWENGLYERTVPTINLARPQAHCGDCFGPAEVIHRRTPAQSIPMAFA